MSEGLGLFLGDVAAFLEPLLGLGLGFLGGGLVDVGAVGGVVGEDGDVVAGDLCKALADGEDRKSTV